MRVVDGDTVDLDLMLGFGVVVRQRCRLAGIDAPEMRGVEREAGIAATAHLEMLLSCDSTIICRTQKDKQGKYGRYIATLWTDAAGGGDEPALVDINQEMIDDGFATKYQA